MDNNKLKSHDSTSRLRDNSATRLFDNITSKLRRDISSSRDHASRSRESSISRDQADFSCSATAALKYHKNDSLKDQKLPGDKEEIRIAGSNRIYKYSEPPSHAEAVDYPEIMVASPAREDSVYENLPPQVDYDHHKQTTYPQHKFDNIVQFCIKEHYFSNTEYVMDDLDKSIAEKFNWLVKNAEKCTKEKRDAEEKHAMEQNLLKEESDRRRKLVEAERLKEQQTRSKRRPLHRSKTETKVPEAAEHTKKRLGFFTRKKSDVEFLRKQMGQLQTDSE